MLATLKQWFSNLAACWNHLGVLNDPSMLPVASESPAQFGHEHMVDHGP